MKVGNARCVLKGDQEPAIMDVTKEVKRQLREELQVLQGMSRPTSRSCVENLVEPQIVLDNSPVGQSEANGVEGINPAPHIHEQMAMENYVQMATTLRTLLRITTSCLSTMR